MFPSKTYSNLSVCVSASFVESGTKAAVVSKVLSEVSL